MAKYTLNTTELATLRYMNRHLEKEGALLKCEINKDDACKALTLNEDELEDVIVRLERNYIVTKQEDGSYVMSQSAYDAINSVDKYIEDEEIKDEKPFRLNSDTYNYDEDVVNEYEGVELEFSELRAKDSLGEEVLEEVIEDALSDEEPEKVEIKDKGKKKRKKLSAGDFRFDETAEISDSSINSIINKDITVGRVPSYDETSAEGFSLNNDSYRNENVKNVYQDQHVDFSDIRGGDISGIDENDHRSLVRESETAELRKNTVKEGVSENVTKDLMSAFIKTTQKDIVTKVTDSGETVSVSSVIEDNKGPVASFAKGVVLEGGTFIRDTSVDDSFNSYNEPNVENENRNISPYIGRGSVIKVEPIKQLFDFNQSSNLNSTKVVSVSSYRQDTDEERERRVLKFDAIKRADSIALGETQVSPTLNNDLNIHTAKNMTGSVSGKIEYDIGSTKLSTGAVGAESGFNSVSNSFNGRTQDIEKNADLATARKEANVEMVKNFHTYDFAKLASETGINELKSVSLDMTTGIQGSYTDGMMPAFLATASVAEAIAGKAAFEVNKYVRSQEDKAISVAEKINALGIDINSINKMGERELKTFMSGNGFSEKDAILLYKKADFVAKEFDYRQDIVKKAKTDPMFLSGDQELKEYLSTTGFKGLSAKKQIEILNELNRTNKNAEIRNLDLRKLNKKQLGTLLKKRGIDSKSRFLLEKTEGLKGREKIEVFAGRHGFISSMARVLASSRPSEQDLFGSTIKDTFKSGRNIYDKAVIKITAVKVATDFAKKAYKSGRGFVRVGNGGFTKLKEKSFEGIRQKGLKFSKLNVKTVAKGSAKAFLVKSILKSGKDRISDNLYQTESDIEEKEKKERRSELTNKISGAIDKGKTFEKVSRKVAEKSGKAMKNATKEGFKKAGNSLAKTAGKEAAKAGVKVSAKAGATAGAATAGGAAATTAGTAAGLSAGAVAAIVIAIIIAIIIIIMFLLYVLDGFAMAGYEGSSVVKDEMSTFGSDIGEAFSDGIKKMEHTAILVSDEATDNDEYVDIKKYLEKIQTLDEQREKDALTFANAKIGSYSPESMGLESRQMNGRYGQDASILAGHRTQYYGSEDKKNGYTLHYLDAYGNEIANHSSNAKDVMALCAVIFSNQPDDDNVFPYLIEDQWYLMSPKIKWKESDIYCCDTCKAEYNGYDYDLTTCKGNNYSSKYRNNGEIITYHCNNYSEVSKVQSLIRQGCKVEGDKRTYDHEGCKQREVSTYFYGDGYDTYDLYLDDYISYDDYRWYVDYYGSDYFSRRFYKYEWYCPGDHRVTVCYGHKDIDIYITVYDKEYAIANNIYPSSYNSKTGRYSSYEEYLEDFLATDKWHDDENVKWVDDLYDQDWYDIYGLDVLGGVGFNIGGGLTDADIDSILDNLSDEELSVKQQAIIEFGLKYVGKIPYYWGGKASSLSFEANHFGTTVEADYKGRTRKGLDCSGFVQWVMANNGIKVPGSTGGYSGYSLSRDHSQLKVGDLGFCNPPGSSSNHVGIYAGVDENGNDLWIHCAGSSGSVVNNYNGFKYYISLSRL